MRLEDRERVLWIDAVCIDQTSNEEKSHQVGLMSKIYSLGKCNLVWLGEGAELSERAARAVETLVAEIRDETDEFRDLHSKTREKFNDISSHRYSKTAFRAKPDFEALEALFQRKWFRSVSLHIQQGSHTDLSFLYCSDDYG